MKRRMKRAVQEDQETRQGKVRSTKNHSSPSLPFLPPFPSPVLPPTSHSSQPDEQAIHHRVHIDRDDQCPGRGSVGRRGGGDEGEVPIELAIFQGSGGGGGGGGEEERGVFSG